MPRRYFDERPQQEGRGRGRRLHVGRRHGVAGILGQSRDIARTVEVEERHAHPYCELESRLPFGSGRGLEAAVCEHDRIEIAAGEDEVDDVSLLRPGLRRDRGDQARSDGKGRQPAAQESAAALSHGLSVSR